MSAPPAPSRNPPHAHERWIGPALAIVGTLGFSFKSILVKLGYAWDPVDPITLLSLRMLYSAPFFLMMAWWTGRDATPIARRDVIQLVGMGFLGYYLSSLLDFIALRYITAALERLVLYLYPTMVVLLSAAFLKKPIGRHVVYALVLSYAGIVLVFWHDLSLTGDTRSLVTGGAFAMVSALCYAIYLVLAGGIIGRIGSMRFIAWAMLTSTVFVLAQFVLTRPWSALDVPLSIHALAAAMAIFSTVLPTWMIAEAIRRMGANTTSLIGSLGPVLTIGLAAMILDEPTHAIQLAGAALVLAGVFLISSRRPGGGA